MKKFYLSNVNKKIAGVCGGLSEYLGVDVTVLRIIFLVTALFSGIGIIAYICCCLLAERNPDPTK